MLSCSAPAGGWKTTTSPTSGVVKRAPMRLTSTRWPICERRDHRLARNPVRLDQEGLDAQGEAEGNRDDHDQLEQGARGRGRPLLGRHALVLPSWLARHRWPPPQRPRTPWSQRPRPRRAPARRRPHRALRRRPQPPPPPPGRTAGRARRPPPDPCSGARGRGRACRRGRAGSRASRAGRRRGRRPRSSRSSASAAGNVRSTPTPKDCLRTVKVSRTPSPWRLMTTPSKTCVRRRVPSMTWKWTLTRSPAWKRGTRRSCVRSRESITVLMAKEGRARIGLAGGRSW